MRLFDEDFTHFDDQVPIISRGLRQAWSSVPTTSPESVVYAVMQTLRRKLDEVGDRAAQILSKAQAPMGAVSGTVGFSLLRGVHRILA